MNANADQTPSPTRNRNIVIALFLAALLIFAARQMVDSILPPQGRTLETSVLSAPESAQSIAPPEEIESPAAIQARQERIERERLLAEKARLQREEKLQQAITSRDQAAEIIRLDQERMDQAWSRFYKKPKKCDNASDQGVIVECGNHFIRERQRFEKQWADGKLQGR